MPGQIELAKKLKTHLDEVGAITTEEVKQYLIDQGAEPSKIGLSMGYGKANQRRWWRIEDGMYYPDIGQPDAPGYATMPAQDEWSDPDALETPQGRFATVLSGLGIPTKSIGPISMYVGQNYDLDDASQVWQGLKECQELTPSNRKRVWRTWMSFTGTEPPADLVATVEKQSAVTGSVAVADSPKSRAFIAVNGEVIPAEDGDETGVTFGQALQIANTQSRNNVEPKDDSTMVAMIQAQAQTTAAMLTAMMTNNKEDGSSTAMLMQMMESQRQADRDRAEAERERHKNEMEMERTRLEGERKLEALRMEQSMERMTEMVQAIQAPTNPLGQLDQIVPGLGTKLMDRLFAPPSPPAQISMPGVTGPDGQPVPLDITTWKEMKSIEQKDAVIKQLRENFPQFVQAAAEIAKASGIGGTPQQAPVEPENKGIPQPDPGMVGFQCVNCAQILQAPEAFTEVQCPVCQAHMDRAGNWLNVKDFFPDEPQPEAPDPTPETVTPVVVDPETVQVNQPDLVISSDPGDNVLVTAPPEIELEPAPESEVSPDSVTDPEPVAEVEVIPPEPVIVNQPQPEVIEVEATVIEEPASEPQPDPEPEQPAPKSKPKPKSKSKAKKEPVTA